MDHCTRRSKLVQGIPHCQYVEGQTEKPGHAIPGAKKVTVAGENFPEKQVMKKSDIF